MMAINMESSDIEKEIEELSRQIEERRKLLSKEKGVASNEETDKDLIRESVLENFGERLSPEPQMEESLEEKDLIREEAPLPIKKKGHYLDNLPEEITTRINDLISKIPDRGLEKTIKEAQSLDPASLDAFHDALTDKLYEELKRIKAI